MLNTMYIVEHRLYNVYQVHHAEYKVQCTLYIAYCAMQFRLNNRIYTPQGMHPRPSISIETALLQYVNVTTKLWRTRPACKQIEVERWRFSFCGELSMFLNKIYFLHTLVFQPPRRS